MHTSHPIAALQQAMQQQHINALLIPTADPHLSEYLPDHWQARAYFSGFTGSSGVLVLTHNEAALWTDSRYWEQAEKQLSGCPIALEKQGFGKNHWDWLLQRLPEYGTFAAPFDMISMLEYDTILPRLRAQNITLLDGAPLLRQVWHTRPALPRAPIFVHEAKWVGAGAAEKLARVRAAMHEQGADAHFISALDDVAWLTNLRGSDVAFNPVFLAHLLIDAQTATLFVNQAQLNSGVQAALNAAQITCLPYAAAADMLAGLSGSLLLEKGKTALSLLAKLPENVSIIDAVLPSSLMKSQKTPTEMAHIREAMRQDGAALCGFFAQLEHKMAQNDVITECDIDTLLYTHRQQQPHFVSPSFETIAGFNANGAMPHYRAEPDSCSTIAGNGLLLIDSGGQYLNGTTDITRVIPIGTPNAAQKRDFTLVLKAHIALAQAVFPENILSPMIDAIGRQALWQSQCDFGHGTGHGVGYFLNVHEGPQRIAFQAATQRHQAMKAGMLTSNEPGLYRPNQWGIRIENLVFTQPVASPQETEFGAFLCFETVTLCPIDTRLVQTDLLTQPEKDWLNAYHQKVRDELSPRVAGAAKDWLLRRTQPI